MLGLVLMLGLGSKMGCTAGDRAFRTEKEKDAVSWKGARDGAGVSQNRVEKILGLLNGDGNGAANWAGFGSGAGLGVDAWISRTKTFQRKSRFE